jgi:sialidase-1
MSYDEGHTWPVGKVLEPGLSGYSDLAVLPDGSVICFYENGGIKGISTQTAALTLARFNVEWLTDGEDHLSGSDDAFQQVYLD